MNLGPTVNTAHQEQFAALSADELTLIFISGGGLLECSRRTVNEAFGMSRPILELPQGGSQYRVDTPFLSPDGLMLFYEAQNGSGALDGSGNIHRSSRRSRDATWEAPVNLGTPVNGKSRASENPCISADGLTLLFSNGSGPGNAIFRCDRSSLDSPFGAPEKIWLGSQQTVFYPCWLSSDKSVLLCRREDKDQEPHHRELCLARLESGTVADVSPLVLPFEGNVPWGWLSPDGMTLYFSSTMSGGRGGHDLWSIRRKAAAGPLVKPANIGAVTTISPDRAATLRVLARGGNVTIQTKAGPLTVRANDALPVGDFSLTNVEMNLGGDKPNGFDDADLLSFKGLPKLNFIYLGQTEVTGAGLAVLKSLPSLQKLYLAGNERLGDADLAHLKECRTLGDLVFGDTATFTPAALEQITTLLQLTKLEPPNVLDNENVKLLLRLRKLKMLRLPAHSLSAEALEQLQDLPALEDFTVALELLDRPMSFAAFPSLRGITTFRLTIDAVKSLATAPDLEYLDLAPQARLSPAALSQFALTPLSALKVLNLKLGRPLPSGEPFVAMPRLEKVLIQNNNGTNNAFDDAALLGLAKVTTLKIITLDVPSPLVTSAGLAAFKKLRPDVKIEGPGVPKTTEQANPPGK